MLRHGSIPIKPRQNKAVALKLTTAGKLFLAIFFIVLFEGAFRKWISSSFTVPLVLLRDCLSLYGIWWALKKGKIGVKDDIFKILLFWSLIVISWGIIQLILNGGSVSIYLIGLRFWLLYLWFGCSSALSMTENDFVVIKKALIVVVLLTLPLVIVQFYSAPSAFINRQVDGDEDKVFRLTADFVRTTSLFSFTAGQTTLLAMASPFILSSFLEEKYLFKKRWISTLGFVALAICTLLSGSRASLGTFAIVFLFLIFGGIIFAKGKRKKRKLALLIVSLSFLASVPIIFSSAYEATTYRISDANENESLSSRVSTLFLGEPEIADAVSVVGAGLGMGTNLVGVLSNTKFALGEAETGRILMEGGFIGFLFIFIKLAIILFALWRAFLCAVRTGNLLPTLVWVVLAIAIFTWSVIGQLTANALGFMFFGLGIATLRFEASKKIGISPRTPA